MASVDPESNGSWGMSSRSQSRHKDKIPQGLTHFYAIKGNHPGMHIVVCHALGRNCCFEMGCGKFVVWEDQVASTTLDGKV